MVTRFGMTDALGYRWCTPMTATTDGLRSAAGLPRRAISEATQQKVDAEIRRVILDEQYSAGAPPAGREHRDKVEAMTAALLEWETMDADQVNDIMAGRPPRSPKSSGNVPPASDPSGGAGAEVKPGNATAPA